MEKKKLLKIVATFGVATLLFSSFTEKYVSSHPFVEKLMVQLQEYSNHFSEEKVYLQLDRNFYQPNDYIWYSAWIRNANSLRADNVSEKLYVELIDPKGVVMEKQVINAQEGVGNGGIKISADKGGLYKIKAYTKWQQNTETLFEREVQVQRVVLPNLKMKLEFDRKAYGAGDEVIADLEVKDLEGEGLRLRDFSYLISLDGKLIANTKMTTDFDGNASVKFSLPDNLETRDGLLQILIPHKGQNESISRAIPITFKNIDLQFFPEGGNLVAGLSSNVGFKALNEFGKPADVEGVILNKQGEEICTFKSFHNGMGATKLWPERGGAYTAKITKPEGINTVYELPEVALRGIQMGISQQNKNGVRVKIQATRPQSFHLVAQANDKVLFAKAAVINKEEIVSIKTKDFPMGITRITLFDEKGSVACERLVFINPHKRLNIEIKTNKKQYLPREKVKMDIRVSDHNGKPVFGNFALAVADDKLLTFADDKQGHILSKLFLESELKGKIEEPDFYFDEKEEKGILALDHLLMTQGWRRFDWKEVRSEELVAFEHLKEQSWISGRVVDGKNEGVADAEVSIEGGDAKTKTNQEGYFVFEDIEIGEIGPVMKVTHKGLPTIRKSIVEYKRDYHIVMAKKKGNISGLLLLPSNKKAYNAKVDIYNDNGNKWTVYTDRNGEYTFQQLTPGAYTLNFKYKGLPACQIEKVMVWPSENILISRQFLPKGSKQKVIIENAAVASIEREVNLLLKSKKQAQTERKPIEVAAQYSKEKVRGRGVQFDEIVCIDYKVPLIQQDNTTQGRIITSEDIRKFPSKNILSIAASTAGVSQMDDGDPISIRGSRSGSVDVYVDGFRVAASTVQEVDVEQLQVITGGIPASYGGGMVARLPERKFVGVSKNKKKQAVYFYRESEPEENSSLTIGGGTASVNYSSRGSYYGGYYHQKKRVKRPSKIHTLVDDQARLSDKKCNAKKSENDCYDCANELMMEQLLSAVANSVFWKRKNYAGDVTIEFFVNKKGEAGGIKINGGGYSYYLNKEIKKVFDKLKKWEPARINNKKVASKIVIPISYGDMISRRRTEFRKIPEYYAPKYVSKKPIQRRTDFRSTIFWEPNLTTDKNGFATVAFWNSDDITSLKATVEGVSNNGMLGESSHTYSVQMPFSMTAKMPVVLLEGDEVKVPITLSNNTKEAMNGQLKMNLPDCLILQSEKKTNYNLAPKESRTIYPIFKVVNNSSLRVIRQANISFAFSSRQFTDEFSQLIRFQSDGYPITKVFTGTDTNNEFSLDVKEFREGSMKTQLLAHPNIAGDLLATSERMLRQPSGCFEQTSSSNYPNVLVAQYLRTHGGQEKRALIKKSEEYMKAGYKRLTGYEVKGGGFEWFGKDPAHEALTAYGLLQFTDMARVYPVNKDMVDRTVEWLLNRKDGKGGWSPGKRGLHTWSPTPIIRNAYINWAVSAAGYGDRIKKEIDNSFKEALTSKDAYLLSLIANTLLSVNDKRATIVLERLSAQRKKDGSFHGEAHSITNSKGMNLALETTSLAMLAFIAADDSKYDEAIIRGIKFISNSKTRTGYGSTQATVLCLKAVLAYAERSDQRAKKGQIALYINDELVQELAYNSKSTKSIAFDDFKKYLGKGKQKLEVRFSESDQPIPFEVLIDYAALMPENNSLRTKIALETKLSLLKVKQGQNTRLTTTIGNKTKEVVTSPIAIVGIPAGLSPQPWQLKKLQEEKEVAYYEVLDNKVIFYFYELEIGEEKGINLDLKADIPGRYLGPASSAYLYYENEEVNWVAPERVEVEKAD